MNFPSIQTCYRLIRDMETMEHIIVHSLQVCRVSLFLTDRLSGNHLSLNRDLIQSAALLHDITKTRSLETKENHAQTGAELLSELGYHEVAEIIRQHVLLDEYFASDTPTEAEIVNYADKRVLHDRIAPLHDRMAYILDRYGDTEDTRQRIYWNWKRSEEMETRIFETLNFEPSQLGAEMGSEYLPEDILEDYYRLLPMKQLNRLTATLKKQGISME